MARSLISAESTALTLPRRVVREGLVSAIAAEGNLIVKGDPGVGKSAVVMDAIEPDKLGDHRQAIALNLRHLPTSQLELLALLSAPIDELFSHLTAPASSPPARQVRPEGCHRGDVDAAQGY